MWQLFPLLSRTKDDHLRRAASDGDAARLQQLLAGGAPVDPRKPHHTSALQLAAKAGRLDCARALLAAGADVNRASEDSSPLLQAAAFGHVDMARLLLEHKADPAATWAGNSALHMAARFGRMEVLRLLAPLLELPAAVAAVNADGKSPLMLACSQQGGGDDVVAWLLEAGADPAAADAAGNTALHHAATAGNLAVVQRLLAHANGAASQATPNAKGRTPLHQAAVFGHRSIVEALAQKQRADLTAQDEEGSTVLHMLCKSVMCDQGSVGVMARMLVDCGADPSAKDQAGKPAVAYATCAALKQVLAVAPEAQAAEPQAAAAAAAREVAVLRLDSAAGGSSSSGSPGQLGGGSTGASSSGSGGASKAGKMAGVLGSSGAAGAAACQARSDSWVAKEAMRRHTSEQVEGWTLKAGGGSSSGDGGEAA